ESVNILKCNVMQECSKKEEIETIKKVLYGNGKKGLVAMTGNLYDKVNDLGKSISEMQADVKVLVQFQTQIETKEKQSALHEQKIERIKRDEMVNKRWRIGLTISTILGMLAIIVSLLAINFDNKDNGITEEEFNELWENYKEEHNIRGDTTKISYIS
ncbi:MAG TPA: hypothetical protein VK982_03110, partial [Bacteroidales bacterium]|nr:hypothetical protein [Bacteroidales bacterium]